MNITIRHDDGLVTVDGVSRVVMLGDLPSEIATVQFDTDSGSGLVRFDADQSRQDVSITSFRPYQAYLDRWHEAAPEQLRVVELLAKRKAALEALDDLRLAEAILDKLAPQAVKDYDAALKA